MSAQLEAKKQSETIVDNTDSKTNLLCASQKGVTYTNWAYLSPNYEALHINPNDLYVENGFVKETQTNAFIVALASSYVKGYYNVKLSNNTSYLVKNVDTKADIHTDVNNCYTTSDESIVEVSTYGNTKYSYLGNSLVKDVYVTEITKK